jgi:hypothetical protein
MFIFGLLIAVTLAISWAFAPKKAYAKSNHHPSNHPAKILAGSVSILDHTCYLGFNQLLDHPRPPDIVSWPPAHYAEIIAETSANGAPLGIGIRNDYFDNENENDPVPVPVPAVVHTVQRE